MSYKVKRGKCLLGIRLAERKMSQQELADRLGINRQRVWDWAKGDRQMSFETAKSVANALGNCRADDLYKWEPVPPKRKP